VREIRALTLGQATDWPTAVRHISAVVEASPVDNGWKAQPSTVIAMPTASIRPSP
jgi:hypothetical protein